MSLERGWIRKSHSAVTCPIATRLVRSDADPRLLAERRPASQQHLDDDSRAETVALYAKRELTLSELWIRLIASPRRRASDSCRIFGHAVAASDRGMESVTTTSVSGESAIR